jgi:hypothetical protein
MKIKSRNKLPNSRKNSYTRKNKSRNSRKIKSRNSRNSRKIKGGAMLGLAMANQLAPEGTPEHEVNQKINFYNLNPEERRIDKQSLVESLDKLERDKSLEKLTIDALKNGITAGKINYKDDTTLKGVNYDLWIKYHAVHSMPIPQKSWF